MESKLQNLTKGNVKPIEDLMFVPNHYQEFLLPALEVMTKVMPAIEMYTKTQYFQILNWIVGLGWKNGNGFLAVLNDQNGLPVGYGVGYECNQPFSDRRNLHIVAVYSKTQNTRQTMELIDFGKRYAEAFGYYSISGVGGRLNGSRRRFWQEKLGFKVSYVGFIYHV